MAASNITWKDAAMTIMGLLISVLMLAWQDQRERVATLEGWKEGISGRVLVMEEKARSFEGSVNEMKADMKDLKSGMNELLIRSKR